MKLSSVEKSFFVPRIYFSKPLVLHLRRKYLSAAAGYTVSYVSVFILLFLVDIFLSQGSHLTFKFIKKVDLNEL